MPGRLLIALAAALAIAAGTAQAQPVRGVAAAATRSVSNYLSLERELAQTRGDAPGRARVAADFTLRTPAGPDVRGPEALQRGAPARIRDLDVREEGDVAVVSFLADAGGRTRFVVDMWKGETLLSRYSSAAPQAPRAAHRPSGRE